MRRMEIDRAALQSAGRMHFEAIVAYLKKKKEDYHKALYSDIEKVMPVKLSFEESREKDNWDWVKKFILADMRTLRSFTEKPERLQFEQFKKLYRNRFSAGPSKYVDDDTKYNAYTFLQNLEVTVCPYCDEEYLDILESDEKGTARTFEIDHFFPKSRYPALAMCFYNLVPSGQVCNGLKLENTLGMSPFEEEIEDCTWLYPDLAIGVNIEAITLDDCRIQFHARKGMADNVDVLRLEERYEKHKGKAYTYLKNQQQFDEAKIAEAVRMGFFQSAEDACNVLFDIPLPGDTNQPLLVKLRHDITGR